MQNTQLQKDPVSVSIVITFWLPSPYLFSAGLDLLSVAQILISDGDF